MPNLEPPINQYENDRFRATVREEETNSKFENYLLSYRDECQKTIEGNSHQHPTFLQRYQKIIEIIYWTLKRYRIVIKRNKIQQQQPNEQDLIIIINRIREELDKKRKIAINKNKQSELRRSSNV